MSDSRSIGICWAEQVQSMWTDLGVLGPRLMSMCGAQEVWS